MRGLSCDAQAYSTDDGLIFASVIVGIPYPERIPDGFVTDDRSNLLFPLKITLNVAIFYVLNIT